MNVCTPTCTRKGACATCSVARSHKRSLDKRKEHTSWFFGSSSERYPASSAANSFFLIAIAKKSLIQQTSNAYTCGLGTHHAPCESLYLNLVTRLPREKFEILIYRVGASRSFSSLLPFIMRSWYSRAGLGQSKLIKPDKNN